MTRSFTTVVNASFAISVAQLVALYITFVISGVIAYGVIGAMSVAALTTLPTLFRKRTRAVGYVAMSATCASIALGFASDPRFAAGGTMTTMLFGIAVPLVFVFAFSSTYELEDEARTYERWSTRVAALPFFIGSALGLMLFWLDFLIRRADEADEKLPLRRRIDGTDAL